MADEKVLFEAEDQRVAEIQARCPRRSRRTAMLPDPAFLRFVIPFRRAAWRAANPDVINCMRPGPFGNPFVPVDPRNPEHVRVCVERFRNFLLPVDYQRDIQWNRYCIVHPLYIPRFHNHFTEMRDLIRDLATRDHRNPPAFTKRRFGCSCRLDAPACHCDPIIDYYLKCRKEHEANG